MFKDNTEPARNKGNFELFFNTIDEYLFILDTNGLIIHINDSVKNGLGYTEDELVGKSVLFVHPEDRREEAAKIVRKILIKETKYCHIPLQTKTGELISVETYVSRGEWDGEPALYGVSKDITLLKQSEEKFEKAFRYNVAAMAITSLDNGTYIDVNDAFLKFLECEREEVIGKTSKELGAFVNLEDRIDAINEIMATGYLKNKIVDVYTKNKNVKSGLFSGELYHVGKSKFLLTECIDITERKQKQEELTRKNEELEKAISEKDKFFSIIAHDLKSPFTGFLGLTETLERDFNHLSISELQNIANKLSTSAYSLYRLLSNLLEWSILQRNRTPINPGKIWVKKLATNCIENISNLLLQKEITLHTDIPDNLNIFADMHTMEFVLRNLLSNSIKFTNRKGIIEIHAEEIPGNKVEIRVSDNGIGMDKSILENLFKLDSKVKRLGTEREPSTGLGLLLCKEFIEKNNGKIAVQSEPGKGSTFFILLDKWRG